MLVKLRSELRNPSPAFVLAALALFVALGGSSYAAITLKRNAVLSKHIRDGQVRNADLAADAVNSTKVDDGGLLAQDFAPGQLPAGEKGEKGDRGEPGPQGERGLEGPPNPNAVNAQNADRLDSLDSTDFLRFDGRARNSERLDDVGLSAIATGGVDLVASTGSQPEAGVTNVTIFSRSFIGPFPRGPDVKLEYDCPFPVTNSGTWTVKNNSTTAVNVLADDGSANPLPTVALSNAIGSNTVDYPTAAGGDHYTFHVQAGGSGVTIEAFSIHRAGGIDRCFPSGLAVYD